jgi:hypothetical protein
LHVAFGIARDLVEIEAVETGAEVFALLEDGDPAQPGLESVQADLLEQADVVGGVLPRFHGLLG